VTPRLKEEEMRVVFVHGACVRDGSWWWHLAAAALQERSISSVAPALPSCGESGRPAGPKGPGLPEDVAAVRAALAEGDEPTVVVAHSYGGIVAAEAAAGVESVRHLVLVSSYLPEPGESLSTFGADVPPPFLDFDPVGGTFGVRPELLAETFLQDCAPDIARDAAALVARQTLAVTQQPVRAAAWHDRPTAYLVCAEDRGTPAAAQREFARRADKVIEVKAGHHPFLSQPQTVADIVASLP
jgi:pimeloyl-ACP methyl ester carboxylesterase